MTAEEEVKEAVRQRDGFRCTGCGLSNEENIARHGMALDVHRVVPGSAYSTAEGVCVTVCKKCHRRTHLGHPLNGPIPERAGHGVAVWIDASMFAALEKYISDQRVAPTKTSVVETALRDFLKGEGYLSQ